MHEHIVFHLADGVAIRYSDARRFGYMDLIRGSALAQSQAVQRARHRAAQS